MSLSVIVGIAIFVGVAYMLLIAGPSSNMVVQLDSESGIQGLRAFLAKNGIETFAKNMYSQGIIHRSGGAPAYPSLHVVNIGELSRAIHLSKEYFNKEGHNN